MSIVTIQVGIDHGKVTSVESQLLPETGRGVLTILSAAPAHRAVSYSVENGADGLPLIRAKGGATTSALVAWVCDAPSTPTRLPYWRECQFSLNSRRVTESPNVLLVWETVCISRACTTEKPFPEKQEKEFNQRAVMRRA